MCVSAHQWHQNRCSVQSCLDFLFGFATLLLSIYRSSDTLSRDRRQCTDLGDQSRNSLPSSLGSSHATCSSKSIFRWGLSGLLALRTIPILCCSAAHRTLSSHHQQSSQLLFSIAILFYRTFLLQSLQIHLATLEPSKHTFVWWTQCSFLYRSFWVHLWSISLYELVKSTLYPSRCNLSLFWSIWK